MRLSFACPLALASAAVLSLGLGVTACSDAATGTTPPPQKPPAALKIVKVKSPGVAFEDTSVSAWVKVGQETRLRLRFATLAGGGDRDFARLKVNAQSLFKRPDGTLFVPGDSVLITMRIADSARLVVEFLPAGLQFNPAEPAELEMHYDDANGDYNDDGKVDPTDVMAEMQLRVWRQETPGDPFVQVGGTLLNSLKECDTKVAGFTRYALAY
jgi:hypothetical protein